MEKIFIYQKEVIVLGREDLLAKNKNVNIEDLRLHHFAFKSESEYRAASHIYFKDGDESIFLKNRSNLIDPFAKNSLTEEN